jgi:DNA polymerase (family X)
MTTSENAGLAAKLRQMADLLAVQQADGFRVTAYRRAAATLETLSAPVSELLAAEGPPGLVALPTIGRGIASAIIEMLDTGQWAALDRLTGKLEPEQLFQTLPGVGPDLARRIHDELHIDTLEALELAALDGRLEGVSGIGTRRAATIRAAVKERLDGRRVRNLTAGRAPPVALLLDVDREYREKAAAGKLRTITPKRFNPEAKSWLPVLHTIRQNWSFTALFSNTGRAHELRRTGDWVIIYAHEKDGPESQYTVVTEHRGPLAGHRVVRGQVGECLAHYAETIH